MLGFGKTHPHENRCSAIPVKFTPSSPLRFIAAAHTVLPWAFPKLYPDSKAWLDFLNKTHVRYYAELREVIRFGIKMCYSYSWFELRYHVVTHEKKPSTSCHDRCTCFYVVRLGPTAGGYVELL